MLNWTTPTQRNRKGSGKYIAWGTGKSILTTCTYDHERSLFLSRGRSSWAAWLVIWYDIGNKVYRILYWFISITMLLWVAQFAHVIYHIGYIYIYIYREREREKGCKISDMLQWLPQMFQRLPCMLGRRCWIGSSSDWSGLKDKTFPQLRRCLTGRDDGQDGHFLR